VPHGSSPPSHPWCPGLGFAGSIDEVKVFNRAVSAREIRFGYLASARLPFYWPFDLIL
jgi:hypothetical protein